MPLARLINSGEVLICRAGINVCSNLKTRTIIESGCGAAVVVVVGTVVVVVVGIAAVVVTGCEVCLVSVEKKCIHIYSQNMF